MTVDELHRLLLAPELVVIDLADHALRALRLALLAEHPTLDDDANIDEAPVLWRARALLRRADDLRRALDAYRHQVDRVLRDDRGPDPPF
jgi:hypothetical protein